MLITADAILFDNDGVLVDSHQQVEEAWRQLAGEFNLDYSMLAEQMVGRRAVDTLGLHLAGDQLTAAELRLEDLEVALAVETRAIAGAHDLLAVLDPSTWAIATSATRRLALARWAGAGIVEPSVTVTAEEVHRGKPNPEPYLLAAQRLGVNPSRCVVFEDSSAGGEAARAAGAQVVAVGDQPWTLEPDVRIADLGMVSSQLAAGGAIVLEFLSASAATRDDINTDVGRR